MSNDKDSIPKETEKLIERAEQSLKEKEKEIFSEIKTSSNELSQIANEETLKLKDTINNQEKVKKAKNIEVLPIAKLMGEAIKRISNSTSVSDLFK